METLKLYAWDSGLGLPSFDPECLATEAYFSLSQIPFNMHPTRNPAMSPSQELPILLVNREPICGTLNIIKYCKKNGYDLDFLLSKQQQGQSAA